MVKLYRFMGLNIEDGIEVITATEALENFTEDDLWSLSTFDETTDVQQTEQYQIFHNYLQSETTSLASTCRCSDYQTQIENSSAEIKQLSEELHKIKEEIDLLHIYRKELDNMKENMKQNQEIEQEYKPQPEISSMAYTSRCSEQKNQTENGSTEIKKLTEELYKVKEEIKNMKLGSTTPSIVPPPPPPLPPPPSLKPAATRSPNKKKNEAKTEENLRPVIALEDILKVKLKKTSICASEQVASQQPSIHPVVSLEILKQVKLKPVSRQRVNSDSCILDVMSSA